jgi:DNA invertase Pin-like site-specific DNA recombinase
MNFYIYKRLSTQLQKDHQDHQKRDVQQEFGEEYARKYDDMKIVGSRFDIGSFQMDTLNDFIQECKNLDVKKLLVYSTDKLSRSQNEVKEIVIQFFIQGKIEIYSVSEERNLTQEIIKIVAARN